MTGTITIAPEPFDSPDATRLREALRAELDERYGADLEPGVKPTGADVAVFLVARRDGVALGCGALRRLDATSAELKRMYVAPAARGLGLGRRILAALEAEAASLGVTRLLLETGPEQPEAIALYTRSGYREIPCWGPYAGAPASRCFGRDLPAAADPDRQR